MIRQTYNITACATCNDSSREIYSLDKHKPGKTFFFFIQKIEAKLELKNNPSTIANDTSLVGKSSLNLYLAIVNFYLVKGGRRMPVTSSNYIIK